MSAQSCSEGRDFRPDFRQKWFLPGKSLDQNHGVIPVTHQNIPQVYAGWGGFVMEQVTEIARFKAMLRFMLILATPASIDGSWPLISRDYNHAQAELR